jgi:hypothetical protein
MHWVEGDLLAYSARLKRRDDAGSASVYDPIRKKFVAATPEELVRQLVIQHLLVLGFAPGRLRVERLLPVAGRKRRLDILVLDKKGEPHLLVECKRPTVAIDQTVMHQAGMYLSACVAPYVVLTNGRHTVCLAISNGQLQPVPNWPLPDSREHE